MTRLPKKRGITQVEEDKSPILRQKNQCFHALAVIGFGNTNREIKNEDQVIICSNNYALFSGCSSICHSRRETNG